MAMDVSLKLALLLLYDSCLIAGLGYKRWKKLRLNRFTAIEFIASEYTGLLWHELRSCFTTAQLNPCVCPLKEHEHLSVAEGKPSKFSLSTFLFAKHNMTSTFLTQIYNINYTVHDQKKPIVIYWFIIHNLWSI